MSGASLSGTLGSVQLMAFTDAAYAEVVNGAAKELGFTRTHVVAGAVAAATDYLKEHASPEILLVEIGSAKEAPAQLDALADVVNPHSKVLVTGKVDSIRFYQWLNDLGIAGYVVQPFAVGELKQAIAKATAAKSQAASTVEPKAKKLIAVMGARGGIGTTMIAANLAAVSAREHGLPTALIDLDPYFGSASLALDLEPGRGLRDAFEKPDRVDALFLERVMVKPFNNLSVFGAEEPLADAIVTQPNAGELVFATLRENFDVMVVDIPRQMNPLVRYVLSQADHTIVVADPQITSLRDSLRLKDYLVETLKRSAPLLLLNRVGMSTANELPLKEFAKNMGSEVAGQLPFLHEAMNATVQGELLTYAPKLQPALQTLRGVMATLLGVQAEKNDPHAKEKLAGFGALVGRLTGKK